MFFDSDNSKEAIKARMLRVALSFWETKNTDEMDPLVKFIIDTLSAELYDVVNDMKNAEGRILEKMAHLLAPDLLTAPSPAHAVMQAKPAESSEYLSDNDQFYLEKKIASKQDGPLDSGVDIYFSPANKVKIFDAQLSYIFTGKNLYSYETGDNKLLLASAKGAQSNESHIYLGMNVSVRLKDLNRMSFFFDLKNLDPVACDFLYQFLPFCKWYIDNKEVSVTPGIVNESSFSSPGDSYTENEILNTIRKNVNNFYKKKFVTFSDKSFEAAHENFRQYPESFHDRFPQQVYDKLNTKLLWIKVVFPTNITDEILNELTVRVNAFPVINCRKNDLRYRLRSGRTIIPIPNVPNERFLAIKSFSDGTSTYKATAYRRFNDEETGTYALRTGGLERFDSRNGRELIQYMLEVLRSESAAFSAFGHDFIAGTLKEMNQFIALLEQKTNTTLEDVTEMPNYIIVKPLENRELMYVEYYSTNTSLANNIRTGTRLQQSSGVTVKSDSLMLLTGSSGGKDKLKSEEKLQAFKYGLLTRERIVTVEDIRNFCFYELGSRLSEVNIKKGFVMSDNPREGVKRTIDVHLTPAGQQQTTYEDWVQLCHQLKPKLQAKSGMTYNYRIMPETIS